jgi:hypothetical protein
MSFTVKGIGVRRGEQAIVYFIPSHTGRRLQKGITRSECLSAFNELVRSRMISRTWFNDQLASCAKEGACNFTTIGGLFELLGIAKRGGRGTYLAV